MERRQERPWLSILVFTRGVPGTITIDGAISLGGLGANLIFMNNTKGTHTTVVPTWATNVSLLPLNIPIVLPKGHRATGGLVAGSADW